MKTVKTILVGLFVIILILFAVQNLTALTHQEQLKLNLFLFELATPPLQMALLLVICYTLGLATAWLLLYPERRRLKKSLRNLEKARGRTEQELNNLRNLPITGDSGANEPATSPGAQSG